jgi:enoyl-CoA hydratase/carnithine racemase
MSPIQLDVKDGVGLVTLNRPERLNALDVETASALAAMLMRLASDPAIRAVVITGAGTRSRE